MTRSPNDFFIPIQIYLSLPMCCSSIGIYLSIR